jgi:hypothetical protein
LGVFALIVLVFALYLYARVSRRKAGRDHNILVNFKMLKRYLEMVSTGCVLQLCEFGVFTLFQYLPRLLCNYKVLS